MELMLSQNLVASYLEPVQQLAPYLSSLNDVGDALDSFNQLADHLLRLDSPQSSPGSPGLSEHSFQSNSSWFTSFPSPSSAESPLSSSSSSSSSLTCFSSEYKSGPASVASSRTSSSSRSKNASAAERYRRRLKGRNCGLFDQLELEQSRNRELRKCLNAKLALYREFVAMLAHNVGPHEQHLAGLGVQSLSQVLGHPSRDQRDSDTSQIMGELQDKMAAFQRIIQADRPTGQSKANQIDEEEAAGNQLLVYDFYSDRFIERSTR